MVRLLLLLGLLGLLYVAGRGLLRRLPPERRGRALRMFGWAGAAALLMLVLAGRVHWSLVALPPLAVVLRWGLQLLVALPLLSRALRSLRGEGAPPRSGPSETTSQHGQRGASGERAGPAGGRASMTGQQALEVLGLEQGASHEQIVAAHRRLMQKMHPDTGGSTYLAAQINQARDVLLRR